MFFLSLSRCRLIRPRSKRFPIGLISFGRISGRWKSSIAAAMAPRGTYGGMNRVDLFPGFENGRIVPPSSFPPPPHCLSSRTSRISSSEQKKKIDREKKSWGRAIVGILTDRTGTLCAKDMENNLRVGRRNKKKSRRRRRGGKKTSVSLDFDWQ